ncbi:dihydroxyacetone kinase subunit L [Isoptericola sp. NEAU-Y5]|uniref:Dihydroxyacetone kinase subunit L n=1 Tax=Isoptericola luteus TaxID=2879484 RepID=A0ABS7ZHF9_9MICO|nr:dihydroxyacetone kinase subunit DhaL [Isoptericola sp. NEAU-Y5]MCA5893269.1 dihydroxyacetone kinase subunit L [Isoptericola sp. NEAU-Y5]
MGLDVAWAERWVRRTAERIAEAKGELTELDRQIGDGDHGENLHRGFQAVVAKLDESGGAERTEVGDVLMVVATTLMSKVGGASGPLYGTAFLRAAKRSARREVDGSGVVVLLEAALEGVTSRGKAEVGEKTMVDALAPAVEAATAASDAGQDPAGVLRAAAEAAEAGAEATVPLVATKGRASYLGERSAGHMDPGSRSSAIILRAAADTAQDVTGTTAP